MMNIDWNLNDAQDLKFRDMEKVFIEQYEKNKNAIAMDHYEIWNAVGQLFLPADWKEFRMDIRVDSWYETEMRLAIKAGAIKTLQRIAKEGNKSTADVQALNQFLAQIDKTKNEAIGDKIFVYGFIPLNESEANAPNVRIIETIPQQIADAIKYYNQTNTTK